MTHNRSSSLSAYRRRSHCCSQSFSRVFSGSNERSSQVDNLDVGALGLSGTLGSSLGLGGVYKGDLMLSLKWAPHDHKPGKGSLHVIVKEASNLHAIRSNGTSDPFCKWLVYENSLRSETTGENIRRSGFMDKYPMSIFRGGNYFQD